MMRQSLGACDRALLGQGRRIVGVDEVGRGCLAGPVVVAGVAFASIPDNPEIQDSKVLTARRRARAVEWLQECCEDWLVVEVWVELIDRVNILEATRLAMATVLHRLAIAGSVGVVDGVDPGPVPGCRLEVAPGADGRFFSVAAASLLAKVHRDRIMARLAESWCGWDWHRNAGYGTVSHRRALDELGRSLLHRKSFRWKPVLG